MPAVSLKKMFSLCLVSTIATVSEAGQCKSEKKKSLEMIIDDKNKSKIKVKIDKSRKTYNCSLRKNPEKRSRLTEKEVPRRRMNKYGMLTVEEARERKAEERKSLKEDKAVNNRLLTLKKKVQKSTSKKSFEQIMKEASIAGQKRREACLAQQRRVQERIEKEQKQKGIFNSTSNQKRFTTVESEKDIQALIKIASLEADISFAKKIVKEEHEQCALCYSDMKNAPVTREGCHPVNPKSDITMTNCGHKFHTDCIRASMGTMTPNAMGKMVLANWADKCPKCRKKLVDNFAKEIQGSDGKKKFDTEQLWALMEALAKNFNENKDNAKQNKVLFLQDLRRHVGEDAWKQFAAEFDKMNSGIVGGLAPKQSYHGKWGGSERRVNNKHDTGKMRCGLCYESHGTNNEEHQRILETLKSKMLKKYEFKALKFLGLAEKSRKEILRLKNIIENPYKPYYYDSNNTEKQLRDSETRFRQRGEKGREFQAAVNILRGTVLTNEQRAEDYRIQDSELSNLEYGHLSSAEHNQVTLKCGHAYHLKELLNYTSGDYIRPQVEAFLKTQREKHGNKMMKTQTVHFSHLGEGGQSFVDFTGIESVEQDQVHSTVLPILLQDFVDAFQYYPDEAQAREVDVSHRWFDEWRYHQEYDMTKLPMVDDNNDKVGFLHFPELKNLRKKWQFEDVKLNLVNKLTQLLSLKNCAVCQKSLRQFNFDDLERNQLPGSIFGATRKWIQMRKAKNANFVYDAAQAAIMMEEFAPFYEKDTVKFWLTEERKRLAPNRKAGCEAMDSLLD